jgi:hypothetical protein
MIFATKLLILFLKTSVLFIHNGPEFIFELYNIATLYIPDCMDELFAFHADFLTKEHIIRVYGEAYYQDYLDFCYGDTSVEQVQHHPCISDISPEEVTETENPQPKEFDNQNISEEENNKSSEKKPPVRLRRRISPGPHPGIFTNSPEYFDFLAKKLNPSLNLYTSSIDLLGEKFPPADGSLINDFFSEGFPKYKFPTYYYFYPDFFYPFNILPNPQGHSFFIPFDGYSMDGKLLNKNLSSDELRYGFSKNIFVFAKTAYDFMKNPAPFDPELEEFFIDVYRAFTRPRYVRKVYYKSKKDFTKTFRVRKRKKDLFKNKK